MAAEPLYRERAPRAALRDFVHCIWTFEAPADETPQPIAPDGRCELILQCGAPYREGDGSVHLLREFFRKNKRGSVLRVSSRNKLPLMRLVSFGFFS